MEFGKHENMKNVKMEHEQTWLMKHVPFEKKQCLVHVGRQALPRLRMCGSCLHTCRRSGAWEGFFHVSQIPCLIFSSFQVPIIPFSFLFFDFFLFMFRPGLLPQKTWPGPP